MNTESFKIDTSPIHGVGLFTEVFIPWGTQVLEYKGELISKSESKRRERKQEAEEKGRTFIFNLNDTYDLDGNNKDNIARFINHSCHPNLGIIRTENQLFYYSLKDIEATEELTADLFDDDDLRCNCKRLCCRKLI